MNSYGDEYVQCPFYSKSDFASIFCEGVEDDMATKNIFRLPSGALLKKKKEEYMLKHCCDDYKGCKIYQMLMKKYD